MPTYLLLILCVLLAHSYCAFIQTPVNISICLGSTAQFSCAANDVINVLFLVNSNYIANVGSSGFITSDLIAVGNTKFRSLTVVEAANSYLITCTIIVSQGKASNSTAYLNVQGPPSAPTDLNATAYNGTATLLVWGLPPGAQSPSLFSYAVVIRNGSGTPVYSETVREPQLVIATPDPCGHYEATVTPMCGNITGVPSSSVELGEHPHSISRDQVHIAIWYSLFPSDNVTVTISVPFSLMVCFYNIVAASGYEGLSFSHVKSVSISNENQSTITVSLPPNKHFNLTINAYNGYGNTSTTVVISTFDVVGVSVNTSSPMGLVCLFNIGSLARGCLVYLTDTDTGVTYCRVVWRSLDTPVNMSLCPSSNGPLYTGVYSVKVYDIERDGSVSSESALVKVVSIVHQPVTGYNTPSFNFSKGSSMAIGSSYFYSHSTTGTSSVQGNTIGISTGSAIASTIGIVGLFFVLTVCLHQKRKTSALNLDRPPNIACASKSDPMSTLESVSDYAITTHINRPVIRILKDSSEQYSALHQSPESSHTSN